MGLLALLLLTLGYCFFAIGDGSPGKLERK